MKYAGVVVTYNRKKELLKNINSILAQTKMFDRYYIVDNCSTDGTCEYLKEHHVLEDDRITLIMMPENIGGAGGFSRGLKQAFEDGFDFICMMDDDGRPLDINTFQNLYDAAQKLYRKKKKLMLNSLVVCDTHSGRLSFGMGTMISADEVRRNAKHNLLKGLINPFNGTLLTRELIQETGFPDEKFFIRGDEVDYQSRAQQAGAFIATVVDSVYYHPSAEMLPLRWRGRTVYFGICPPWKVYYTVRNYVYRIRRDRGISAAVREFVFQFYGTVKCSPEAKKCIPLLFAGFWDGMTGRLGMRLKPGETFRFRGILSQKPGGHM